MSVTNATFGKKALYALLLAASAPAGLLDGWSVDYAYNGNVAERSMYMGGWRMDSVDDVAETPGVMLLEVVTYSVYLRAVKRPREGPDDVQVTDDMCDAGATAIGQVMKANPRLAGGLSIIGIYSALGDYSQTDDETVSNHALQVRTTSRVAW